MMRVRFFETTIHGTQEVGRVEWSKGEWVATNKRLVRLLFGTEKPDKGEVETAMRNAPERFDGAYLRATFEAIEDNGMSNPVPWISSGY